MTRTPIGPAVVAAVLASALVGSVPAVGSASTEHPSGDIDIERMVPGEGTFELSISYECRGLRYPWLLGSVEPLGFEKLAGWVASVRVVCDGEPHEAEFVMTLDPSRIRRFSQAKGEIGVQLLDGDTVIAEERQNY
ncbi:hypothetical protein [Nocardia mexicana]|uniref:Uncharacterized protein n=1 Tax=Nocardia mexicana TaxID=279262 RepID=A0A370H449_9NOCA|nr:hypothetical protein [Nocardia mexicana]RDI50969.1 hypothetical protein DFR68_105446 [Nocardia mexicana]